LKSQKPAHSRALPGHIHIVIFVLCLHGPNYFVATFALTHVSYRAPFWDSLQILRNANLILFRRVQNRDEHFSKFVDSIGGYKPPLSNSKNAVSFSSARTIKRFSSSRCASATKIVCPLELIVDTQPQLHPALLSLLAMVSKYFIHFSIKLMINCRV
jgi:hypothetical protein